MSHDLGKPVRYNRGMICKEKRATGMVWVFRWSEQVNGRRRQHKDVIGTTKQFSTEAAANKEADRLRCQLVESKGDCVWGPYQSLPQPRVVAFVEIGAQGKQVIYQELDRACLAWSSR